MPAQHRRAGANDSLTSQQLYGIWYMLQEFSGTDGIVQGAGVQGVAILILAAGLEKEGPQLCSLWQDTSNYLAAGTARMRDTMCQPQPLRK